MNLFAENIRDGFTFDPIHVEAHPEEGGKYRILDGVHRWQAHREIGAKEIAAKIIRLDGLDPLLYAARKAIGPRQLTEEETRDTARRAYHNNPRLTSDEIGRSIGRSRRTVDSYISDLRAVVQMGLDLKIFRMYLLSTPQERIAQRLGEVRETIRGHLAKMAALPNPPNADLKRGFMVPQVAEKHGWPEPLVWSVALEGKDDLERFKALNWGLRTWDLWSWNDCDRRFGDEWPGRVPAQMIAHILFYFSNQNDLVFDPPYFSKKAGDYDEGSISGLTREGYLDFLESFFLLAHDHIKKTTRLAFINADWRDFQSRTAYDEVRDQSILINDYLRILDKAGWRETHIIQAPMSSERFEANVVAAMQKKRILGVTSRYVIIAKKA